MVRLGTRVARRPTYDLHQGDFVADERAIGVGARCSPRSPCVSSPAL